MGPVPPSAAPNGDREHRPRRSIRIGARFARIKLDVDLRIVALCCRYNSGSRTTSDYDAADAFVALCTALVHAEGECREAFDGVASVKEIEGAVWIPRIAAAPAPSMRSS